MTRDGEAALTRHPIDRPRRRSCSCRVLESEEPVALGRAGARRRPAQEHRLAPGLARSSAAGCQQRRRRGALRPGPADPARRRSAASPTRPGRARPAVARRAGGGSGETINLAVPRHDGVEHLAQVDSRHFIGAANWLGRSVRLRRRGQRQGVPGVRRALPPARADARHRPDDHRPRQLAAARRVRARLATAVDELELGLSAMAAPVRGAGGDVSRGALASPGPSLRLTPARIARAAPMLIDEARTLSRRLGHREQGERAA